MLNRLFYATTALAFAITLALAVPAVSAEKAAANPGVKPGCRMDQQCKNCPGPQAMGNMSSCNGPMGKQANCKMHGGPQNCPKMKN